MMKSLMSILACLYLLNHFTDYDEICYSMPELKSRWANLISIIFLDPLEILIYTTVCPVQ
jgi:hypothetical protein